MQSRPPSNAEGELTQTSASARHAAHTGQAAREKEAAAEARLAALEAQLEGMQASCRGAERENADRAQVRPGLARTSCLYLHLVSVLEPRAPRIIV